MNTCIQPIRLSICAAVGHGERRESEPFSHDALGPLWSSDHSSSRSASAIAPGTLAEVDEEGDEGALHDEGDASSTRTPSFVPSIVAVSSAPKHIVQANVARRRDGHRHRHEARSGMQASSQRPRLAQEPRVVGDQAERRRQTPRWRRSGCRRRRRVRTAPRHQTPNSTASAADIRIRNAWTSLRFISGSSSRCCA